MPHPPQDGGYIVVIPNASNFPGNNSSIVVVSGYNASLMPGPVDTSGADGTVSFLELPLWIQLHALPGMLFGVITTLLAAALAVRHRRSGSRNKESIMAFVLRNPGCTAPELARGRSMNIGTVRYHIQRLQDEGRVVLKKIGKYSRIFVNSHTYDDREKRIASHLRSDSGRRIITAVMEAPGISNQALSEKLGMEKSLAYRYVQKLHEDGIVTFEWEGRNKLYYIDTAARETLVKLMPLHYQCPGLKKE